MGIEVENYFGGCPECGGLETILNIGREHWAACHYHQTKWCVGENLFSSWRNETERDWKANRWLLAGYTTVNALPSTDPTAYADSKTYERAMQDPRLKRGAP